VEIVEGDLLDFDSVSRALKGLTVPTSCIRFGFQASSKPPPASRKVLGRKITYVSLEIEALKEVLKDMGRTPHFIQHVSAVAQDCRDGIFSGTNDLVEKLTGQ
jgi:hypothetical protein